MRADQWEELVCGDLKEANTLVCEPDHEHKIYPCLKLADFGILLAASSHLSRCADSFGRSGLSDTIKGGQGFQAGYTMG